MNRNEEFPLAKFRRAEGILLAAASVGRELRESSGDFITNVASALELKARGRLTGQQLRRYNCLAVCRS